MIDRMEEPTSLLPDETFARIQYFMLGFHFKLRTLRDCVQFYTLVWWVWVAHRVGTVDKVQLQAQLGAPTHLDDHQSDWRAA
jgi:hypothetical protein